MKARNLLASALVAALGGAAAPYDVQAAMMAMPSAGASLASDAAADRYLLLPSKAIAGATPGLELVQHYGALQLWKATPAAATRLAAIAVEQPATVDLPGGIFDPADAGLAKAAAGDSAGPQVHVVQFVGPVVERWLEELRASGLRPIQYVNHNAYLVLAANDKAKQGLQRMASRPWVRAISLMSAQQKLQAGFAAQLDADAGARHMGTIILADSSAVAVSKREVEALVTPHKSWFELMPGQVALQFEGSADAIRALAGLGDALVVEQRGERIPFDEVQAQIMAGKLQVQGANTVPTGPGYYDWLAGLGFSTDPADYPIIGIVDDGIGNGNTDNGAGDFRLTRNGDGSTSRVTFSVSCDGGNTAAARRGDGGHGHINATIAAGYDQTAGAPFRDPNGYLRGQGINPWGRVANFEIFNSGGPQNCGSDDYGVVQAQAAQGVKISSNSWGYCANSSCTQPLVTYNASAVAYDRGSRDANGNDPGTPALITVFAAGNDGPSANTVATPGLAKNVITVGASENVRPSDESGNWNDGCGIGGSGANNAMDVISFSSRGPSVGGRTKPELIAPGTHVQGSASTSSGYDGSGVCDRYRPTGQTSLAASSGTSHSTPAVAGAASLVYRWLQTEYGIADASPALVKSYFIAHPTYLTGVGANDSLPSNSQGYGMPDLDAAFDAGTARVMIDQTEIFDSTGETREYIVAVADPAKPVRIALAWTDAPGLAGSSSPQVNNLDLVVDVDGVTYRGNRFSGAFSSTGGTADTANNYEAVFLPAGAGSTVTIRVIAAGINGDGVPGTGDGTDQDFALVCSNCSEATAFALTAAPAAAEVCAGEPVQFDVDVLALNGYTGTVTLSQTGAPADHAFDTNPVAAPGSSQLTLETGGVAGGVYVVEVHGDDGTDTRTRALQLTVSDAPPGAPLPATPADGAAGQQVAPALAWTAAAGALGYTIEVASDPQFDGHVVWSATVPADTLSATASDLDWGRQYWWRVTAENPCGSQASALASFSTRARPGVLLVDDAGGYSVRSRWTDALDAVVGAGRYAVHVVEDDASEPSAAELAGFRTVVWYSGGLAEVDGMQAGPTPASESALGNWLDGGACLFLSSQDYRWDRGVTSAFMTDYLGATVPNQDVSMSSVAGSGVYASLSSNLSYGGLFTGYPDRLDVSAGGSGKAVAFTYTASGQTRTSAVSHLVESPQRYFTTWTAFALEAATATVRQQTLQRFVDQCGYGSNEAPVAIADAVVVTGRGGTATELASGEASVKTNDIDTEDGVPAGSVALVDGPEHGSLTLNPDGTFEYVHDGGSETTDRFTYTVQDADGAVSHAAVVEIRIEITNEAPEADSPQAFGVLETVGDGSVVGSVQASDPDGDVLSFAITAGNDDGVFAIDADSGEITVASAAALGTDGTVHVLTVAVSDGNGGQTEVTVTITVLGTALFADGFED